MIFILNSKVQSLPQNLLQVHSPSTLWDLNEWAQTEGPQLARIRLRQFVLQKCLTHSQCPPVHV